MTPVVANRISTEPNNVDISSLMTAYTNNYQPISIIAPPIVDQNILTQAKARPHQKVGGSVIKGFKQPYKRRITTTRNSESKEDLSIVLQIRNGPGQGSAAGDGLNEDLN